MYLRNYNFVCFINDPEFISYKAEEKQKKKNEQQLVDFTQNST